MKRRGDDPDLGHPRPITPRDLRLQRHEPRARRTFRDNRAEGDEGRTRFGRDTGEVRPEPALRQHKGAEKVLERKSRVAGSVPAGGVGAPPLGEVGA